MLVLTRRKNESIWIGRDIRITVTGIRGNYVRLGIVAPPEIQVHRQELRDRIEEALQPAVASTAGTTSGGLSTRTSLPALEPARQA